MCRNCGLEIDAGINTCLNIARKAGYTPPTPTRIETYTPTHQGATPLNEKEKSTRQETITPKRGNREPAPNGAGRLDGVKYLIYFRIVSETSMKTSAKTINLPLNALRLGKPR